MSRKKHSRQEPESIKNLKESCEECSGHQELDTSQGDFTTIAVGILTALAIYALVPALTGIHLGDYPKVIVYCGFLVLVGIFWFIAEKVKEFKSKK